MQARRCVSCEFSFARCVAMAVMTEAVWPLTGLVVVTPRLKLRYITDDLGTDLARLAVQGVQGVQGVQDPATMPFSTPWTDVPCI